MPELCPTLQNKINEYRSLVQWEAYSTAADLLAQLAAPLLKDGQAQRFLDLSNQSLSQSSTATAIY